MQGLTHHQKNHDGQTHKTNNKVHDPLRKRDPETFPHQCLQERIDTLRTTRDLPLCIHRSLQYDGFSMKYLNKICKTVYSVSLSFYLTTNVYKFSWLTQKFDIIEAVSLYQRHCRKYIAKIPSKNNTQFFQLKTNGQLIMNHFDKNQTRLTHFQECRYHQNLSSRRDSSPHLHTVSSSA